MKHRITELGKRRGVSEWHSIEQGLCSYQSLDEVSCSSVIVNDGLQLRSSRVRLTIFRVLSSIWLAGGRTLKDCGLLNKFKKFLLAQEIARGQFFIVDEHGSSEGSSKTRHKLLDRKDKTNVLPVLRLNSSPKLTWQPRRSCEGLGICKEFGNLSSCHFGNSTQKET
jgi:hypothetical protein